MAEGGGFGRGNTFLARLSRNLRQIGSYFEGSKHNGCVSCRMCFGLFFGVFRCFSVFYGVLRCFFACFNPWNGTSVPLRGHVLYRLDCRRLPSDGTSFGLFVALFQMLLVLKYVISRLFGLSDFGKFAKMA